jgi:hypothetical protein
LLGWQGRRTPDRNYNVDLETDQFGRKLGNPIGLTLGPPVLDKDRLSLNVAEITQSLAESLDASGLRGP